MEWLEKNGQGLLDLMDDSALLGAIGALEKHFDAGDTDNELDDVFDALNKLGIGGPTAESIRSELEARGLDAIKTRELWKKLRKRIEDELPDEYQVLGYPLHALATSPVSVSRTLIWPLLEESMPADAGISPKGLALSLTGESECRMEFEAVPAALPKGLPEGAVPLTDKQLVRIGLHGALKAGTEARVPANVIQANLAAGGGLTAEMNWYFNNAGKSLFATALSRDLLRLQSPFDLEALNSLVSPGQSGKPTLACLAINLTGDQSVSGGMKVSRPLLAGVAGNVAVSGEFNFRMKRGGEYRYLLYNDGGPVLSIRRSRLKAQEQSLSLAFDFDFTPLYDNFRQLVLEKVDELSDFMERLEEILPRDDALRAAIGEKLDAFIDDSPHGALLKGLIGFDAEKSTGDLLAENILSQVETTTARWSGEAEEAAERVADRVLERLGLLGESATSLRTKALEQATAAIASENKRLNAKLRAMVTGDNWQELTDRLEKLGNSVDRGVSSVDARLKRIADPVREVLSSYQKRVKKLRDALQTAAEAKLHLQFSTERSESEHESLDLQVRFRAINDVSKSLYRQMLCGSLNSVADLLRNPPEDSPVEFLAGELERITHIEKKSAFEISLFGVNLNSSRHLDVDVSYQVNSDGNIRAISKGEIKACRQSWREGRCLKFVDVFELAVAEQTRSLNLNLTLSQEDEDLDADDVKGFFSSLERERLLIPGTSVKAMARLADIDAQNPGAKVNGRLEMGFSLQEGAIETLLGLGGHGNQVREDTMAFRVAAEELVLVGQRASVWEFKLDPVRKKRIEQYFPRFNPPLPTDLLQLIVTLDQTARTTAEGQVRFLVENDDSLGEHLLEDDLFAIHQYHQHADNIRKMVVELRKVYLSSHNPEAWNEQAYRDVQIRLNDYLHQWLKVGKKFFFFLPDEIRPFTIGFIRIMAKLADIPLNQERNIISAKLTLNDQAHDLTGVG